MKSFQSSLQPIPAFRFMLKRSRAEQGGLLPDCECKGTATFETTQEKLEKKPKFSANRGFLCGWRLQNGHAQPLLEAKRGILEGERQSFPLARDSETAKLPISTCRQLVERREIWNEGFASHAYGKIQRLEAAEG